ncbi:helix-turn-helix domain-containing protein, partial [Glaesserella parasuis]|nr:helix-turn-helix domain-containing protein [Glaesserella parasuis]
MFLQKLGLTIKEARKNYGLSQEQLALKINMDRTYLASVEAGKR